MATNTVGRRSILLGTPLLLTLLLLTHPLNPRTQLATGLWPWADWWITLHILQLGLFGLMGYAVTLLLAPLAGIATTISRIAMGVFVVFYNAGDAIAGITTGILVRNARSLPADQQTAVIHAVQMVFVDPTKNLVFTIGSYAWCIGILATIVALYQAREPLLSLALLCPVAVLLGFMDHQPPSGPLAFGLFFLAAVWLEFAPRQPLQQRGKRAQTDVRAEPGTREK